MCVCVCVQAALRDPQSAAAKLDSESKLLAALNSSSTSHAVRVSAKQIRLGAAGSQVGRQEGAHKELAVAEAIAENGFKVCT